MSYSGFNNAYQNINQKLLETFDGITAEDLNENNTQFDYSKVPINYIKSEEELKGTTLQNLNNKLTHRICIQLYLDPTNLNNPNMPIVFKHISSCSLCQNEINKKCQPSTNLEVEQHKNNYMNIQDNNKVLQASSINQSNKNIEKFENVGRINLTVNELETLLRSVINNEKKNDEYENINKIFKSLENKKNPMSIEINFLNIMICLLLILLIIDIILRIKS